jgi:hypothetical protein
MQSNKNFLALKCLFLYFFTVVILQSPAIFDRVFPSSHQPPDPESILSDQSQKTPMNDSNIAIKSNSYSSPLIHLQYLRQEWSPGILTTGSSLTVM